MNPLSDNQLVQDLGLEALPPEQQQAALTDFVELVQIRLSERLVAQLSEADLEELQKDDDEARLQALLEQRFPDYTQQLEQTIAECREELMDQAQQAQAYIKDQEGQVPPAPAE